MSQISQKEAPNNACMIIAGPCSIWHDSLPGIRDIARIQVSNRLTGERQRAIAGVRVVGLKSRTANDPTGEGMGIDFSVWRENAEKLALYGSTQHFEIPPSVIMAGRIFEQTGLTIATEVCDPWIQLPPLARVMGEGSVFVWGPSVQALGHHYATMGAFAKDRLGWTVGIKNPKWLGNKLEDTENKEFRGRTSMEATWEGLASWTGLPSGRLVMIHRGVDVPDRGDYRNAPVHELARRVVERTGIPMGFDPSHTFGPKKRGQIVEATVEAMSMRMPNGLPLYNRVLVEVEAGTKKTDVGQHITQKELATMCEEIAKFRDLVPPEELSPRRPTVRREESEYKSYE